MQVSVRIELELSLKYSWICRNEDMEPQETQAKGDTGTTYMNGV